MAPPPSLALMIPEVNCGVGVMVKVADGVADMVVVGVKAVGLTVRVVVTVVVAVSVAVEVMVVVVVIVTVPSVGVLEGVEVLEEVGLLVMVTVGLGVKEGVWLGTTVSVAVGVEVETDNRVGSGKPVPIK